MLNPQNHTGIPGLNPFTLTETCFMIWSMDYLGKCTFIVYFEKNVYSSIVGYSVLYEFTQVMHVNKD